MSSSLLLSKKNSDVTENGTYKHTTSPIVTGTSVLALKYKDGVMMASDCLASYGSLARFRNVRRLQPIGTHTILGASGEISDFQFIQNQFEGLMLKEHVEDGQKLETSSIYRYLSNVMYGRRSKVDPLWNKYIVAGVEPSKNNNIFLGFVDLYGTTYQSSVMATGFGAHIALPIMRKYAEPRADSLTEEEASKILDDCMRVLYYRDARSFNKIQKAKVTAQGVEISEPYSLSTNWDFAESIIGYGS
ncbi:putative proteasome subunit beta type-7 [Smittium mucronatum]|uniref:Proteasome subunit beta n=1 Tax=Smittium mucronatum TaxID=133383 RepID=A0A1R0H2G6_9FUNG|nr:putative proteasome subunit beta type-7 [Smittium mucronatum]